jgi:ethanolamine utilization protein EutQ (cupin superfamily)
MEKGKSFVFDYNYEEMKLPVEGEMTIGDETRQTVTVKPADVLCLPKGAASLLHPPAAALGSFAAGANGKRVNDLVRHQKFC